MVCRERGLKVLRAARRGQAARSPQTALRGSVPSGPGSRGADDSGPSEGPGPAACASVARCMSRSRGGRCHRNKTRGGGRDTGRSAVTARETSCVWRVEVAPTSWGLGAGEGLVRSGPRWCPGARHCGQRAPRGSVLGGACVRVEGPGVKKTLLPVGAKAQRRETV